MRFHPPLVRGRLVRRYQRFLADVDLDDGRRVTAHCANPGSMLTLDRAGARVYLSRSDNPARKLAWSLEAIRAGRTWVGIHTLRANRVVEEGLRQGRVPALEGYPDLRAEARWEERSRADFLLEDGRRPRCWVEVKSVTLARGNLGLFPDSVTERGRKHLEILARRARAGDRAVLLFAAMRADVAAVGPADGIDPEYGRALRRVADRGVEILAHRIRVGRRGLVLAEPLPVNLGPHGFTPDELRG